MAITYSQVPVQIHEVSLKNKPEVMLALSPKGTVPVLHCSNGRVIEQSLDIMVWALEQNDPSQWLNGYEIESSNPLISANDGAFKHWLDRYKYFERYPGVAQYMERTREEARANGYVETVFGRRLWLPDIKANGPRRQGAERAAINAPMQGTAADLIKLAMVAVQNWLEQEQLKTRMLLQVHDELVFEAPPEELEHLKSSLPKLMGSIAELKVPLIVSIGVGDNWEEAH